MKLIQSFSKHVSCLVGTLVRDFVWLIYFISLHGPWVASGDTHVLYDNHQQTKKIHLLAIYLFCAHEDWACCDCECDISFIVLRKYDGIAIKLRTWVMVLSIPHRDSMLKCDLDILFLGKLFLGRLSIFNLTWLSDDVSG